MNKDPKQQYWRSVSERDGGLESALNDAFALDPSTFSRRQFLEAAGFSMSLVALGGCGRAPVETALPLVVSAEGLVPGRMLSYASTCAGCPAGCGLLVGVRDGRPLKMEGMPEHPLSHGGLCAIGQALPLGLYDSQRLSFPTADGKQSDWDVVDKEIIRRLSDGANQGTVVVVTSTVTSPTLQATIDSFLEPFKDSRHVIVDALSSSAILDAHDQTHGIRVLPHYRFDRANVIVSFGADFLGTWISPVEFTAAWRQGRVPSPEHPEMSYHVQLEGRLSLTGSNADRRYRLSPQDYAAVLGHMALEFGKRAGLPTPDGGSSKEGAFSGLGLSDQALTNQELIGLNNRLWAARGHCLVICDSQDIAIQRLVNYINHALDNYGHTLDVDRPSRQRQGRDADVVALIDDLHAGRVSALFVAGTDLTQNLPDRDALVKSIQKVPLVVSCAERTDDFASLAQFVCPNHHPLESWADAEPVTGLISLTQPTLQPLNKTRSVVQSFHRWSSGPSSANTSSAYEIMQSYWRKNVISRTKSEAPFQAFWDQAVHDGFVNVTPNTTKASEFQFKNVTVPEPIDAPSAGQFVLSLYSKVGLTDSRHAHNPWLQELPDPVTKVTWDNYVNISPTAATEYGLTEGDMVRVTGPDGVKIELPVFVQPGQHDRVLAIALGYGVRGTDRFADIGPRWLESRPTVAPGELVGKNAAAFLAIQDGTICPVRANCKLEKIKGRHPLATTQQHHSLTVPPQVAPHGAEVRDVVQHTTLAAFAKNPRAGTPEVHDHGVQQLWAEDHPKTGHHWGLAVDLNCCTGCSACLIACQSENNVPVVGKDEVHRGREMHWIRIDRYYSGDDRDLQATHQPMMCQHCDNAPCETVCPVLATVHGAEGLNEQAYNRCVGTRYCANNCPYKVRRFNWFKYTHDDALQNLALNPDVTVRTRGVMEKCSMCVQRIEDGKLEARRLGLPVVDGAIQTACQQSCPAQAILFGDMNDPDSRIHTMLEDPRRYGVLEEFNFRPSVSYMRVVKNRDDVTGEPPAAEGGHHA